MCLRRNSTTNGETCSCTSNNSAQIATQRLWRAKERPSCRCFHHWHADGVDRVHAVIAWMQVGAHSSSYWQAAAAAVVNEREREKKRERKKKRKIAVWRFLPRFPSNRIFPLKMSTGRNYYDIDEILAEQEVHTYISCILYLYSSSVCVENQLRRERRLARPGISDGRCRRSGRPY